MTGALCDSLSAGEHRNGIPNHPGSSPGTAVHFSHPLGSRTASDSMKEYENKSLSRWPGDDSASGRISIKQAKI